MYTGADFDREDRTNLVSATALRILGRVLAFTAICYAFVAGLRTVQDFDLCWQLAGGQWMVNHRQLISRDVFSYTARGQEWIYPVISQIALYLGFVGGGYRFLSWLGAIACVVVVCLLMRRGGFVTYVLAALSVPMIASRTQPRAEMFTTVLFAAFVSLLWQHYGNSSAPLWLLPVLMIGWVNFHPGFVAGLAMCGIYVLIEAIDLLVAERRSMVRSRLRIAWPWLLSAGVATCLNPWGPYIYSGLLRQGTSLRMHSAWIVEWQRQRVSWASLHEVLAWRDPRSSFWLLLIAGGLAVCVSALRRRWGIAMLLLASSYIGLLYWRAEALFAVVAVIVAGSVLSTVFEIKEVEHRVLTARLVYICGLVMTVLVGALATVRGLDLVSDRYYMRSQELALFGTGLSGWFPERAIAFIQRHHLPGNIFSPYHLGGYVSWRLFPEYSNYIDGRALPFGQELFFRSYELMVAPPDSSTWRTEAAARDINTILVPLSRNAGVHGFPHLREFCASQTWRPVYMDETSAVFVRRTPKTVTLLARLQLDCTQILFGPVSNMVKTSRPRERAELFNLWINAGGVMYALGRYSEALAYFEHAKAVFPDSADLHLLRALTLQDSGDAVHAEDEFLTSIRLAPTEESLFDLGLFYMARHRYRDAAQAFRRGAQISAHPHDMWLMLGNTLLHMGQPEAALRALETATATNPFQGKAQVIGARFFSLVATGRATAWWQLGDVGRAVQFQEQAVQFAPADPKLWLGLADLYRVEGKNNLADQARLHAEELAQ